MEYNKCVISLYEFRLKFTPLRELGVVFFSRDNWLKLRDKLEVGRLVSDTNIHL